MTSRCGFVTGTLTGTSRTHDQMVQAARSGVQNIAEGSQASRTSKKKTELKRLLMWRAPVSKNCGWIMRIFCGSDNWQCGSAPMRVEVL